MRLVDFCKSAGFIFRRHRHSFCTKFPKRCTDASPSNAAPTLSMRKRSRRRHLAQRSAVRPRARWVRFPMDCRRAPRNLPSRRGPIRLPLDRAMRCRCGRSIRVAVRVRDGPTWRSCDRCPKSRIAWQGLCWLIATDCCASSGRGQNAISRFPSCTFAELLSDGPNEVKARETKWLRGGHVAVSVCGRGPQLAPLSSLQHAKLQALTDSRPPRSDSRFSDTDAGLRTSAPARESDRDGSGSSFW